MKRLLILSAGLFCVGIPAFAATHEGEHAAGKAGHHTPKAEKADHWFNKVDANGDGSVSKEEHAAFGDKMFNEADTNQDGVVSKEEMRAHHAKKREQHGMHKKNGEHHDKKEKAQ